MIQSRTSRAACLAFAVKLLLSQSAHAQDAPLVEIQINAKVADADADIADDDYVTWAPTFCRARLRNSTEDLTVVLSNDEPAYYLCVGGNNLSKGILEIGDRFVCLVDGEELRVDASSVDPTQIATLIAAAWNASAIEEFKRFDATAVGAAVLISAKESDDGSNVSVKTVESDAMPSDGQTFHITTRGDLKFAAHQEPWPVSRTADSDTVTLELKGDGSWQPFVVAGRFRKPSTMDKDAVIVAHKGTSDGDVLGERQLMVRVRKNGNRLSQSERDRFLRAMKEFRNKGASGFLMFQELHRLATTASDEAHHQPAFFPWHRALLLHVERELQAIDPSVTLPYWDWDAAAPSIFSEEFMGAPGIGVDIATPVFSAGHPFAGWSTDLPFSSGRIMRSVSDHAVDPASTGYPFMPLESGLVAFANYSQDDIDIDEPQLERDSFSIAGERLSHDPGHGWACGGGNLTRPMRSACDPLFYLLHCQVDRQWAYWQHVKDRFGISPAGTLIFPHPAHYDNQLTFDAPGNMPAPSIDTDHTRQKGSYLQDGMWPWDGTSGGTPLGVETRPVNKEPPREEGNAQGGSNIVSNGNTFGTIKLRAGASGNDHYYNQYVLSVTGGDGNDQSRSIVDYDGTSKTAYVFPAWTTPPSATSIYVIDSENIPGSKPNIPMTGFPESAIKNLWPSAAVIPQVWHMIDYLGRFRPADGLGFCYEDVPYSAP